MNALEALLAAGGVVQLVRRLGNRRCLRHAVRAGAAHHLARERPPLARPVSPTHRAQPLPRPWQGEPTLRCGVRVGPACLVKWGGGASKGFTSLNIPAP